MSQSSVNPKDIVTMKIKTLFIDQAVTMDDDIQYILSKVNLPAQKVQTPTQVYEYINKATDPIQCGKETLFVTNNKGAVTKECPGTCHYTCCDYTILHTGTFCTMDCSYCILQAYFHPPVLQYFAGFSTISESLKQVFSQQKIYRIGTGEYTDSLIWEKISQLPEKLVLQFAKQNRSVLELKTKTVNIDSLLELDHGQKTILSWSLNTPEIIKSEEKGTASLTSRLKAAQKAQAKGYQVAFHFDPIVIYPGADLAYKKVIKKIFEYINPDNIVWISLGTFRYMPALKSIIENRFSDSTICYGEFIQGLDNKMRYFKPLRINIYQAVISAIKAVAPNLMVYFCMEDQDVWEKCLGYFPKKEEELGYLLDKSAAKHCYLDSSLI